jgi:hypothetical protein
MRGRTLSVPRSGTSISFVAIIAFVALGVATYANSFVTSDDDETLAGDPASLELDYGCPEEFPTPVFLDDDDDPKADENQDGIVCTNDGKQLVDNQLPGDDGLGRHMMP